MLWCVVQGAGLGTERGALVMAEILYIMVFRTRRYRKAPFCRLLSPHCAHAAANVTARTCTSAVAIALLCTPLQSIDVI